MYRININSTFYLYSANQHDWFVGSNVPYHTARHSWSFDGEPWPMNEAIDFALRRGWVSKAEALKALIVREAHSDA